MSKLLIPQEWNPREWQLPVIDRVMSSQRLSVFMGMGMGKTSATMTALDVLSQFNNDMYPVLVIAPKKVAMNVWPSEHKLWNHLCHLKVIPIIGSLEERSSALMYKADIYTINYENVEWLVRYLRNKWPFKTVICDESVKLKSFRTRQGGKRAQALAARAKFTKYWFNLTGEPAPNGLQDLWGPQWFIDFGDALEPSYTKYTDKYFTKGYNGFSLDLLPGADKEIAEKIKPSSITIRAEDYFQLDKPVIVKRNVALSYKAIEGYKKLERELFADLLSGRITATNAADKTMKCLQYASGAVYTPNSSTGWDEVHDEKLDALDSIIAEANGEPIVVAYHFKSDLARIVKRFPEAVILKSKKDEDNWNSGKIQILLAHPMSAGHGLNLQYGGRRLVFFTHWWALDPHNQIIERLGPMRQFQAGLKRLVYIYYIVASETIDELVIGRRDSKRDVQELLKEYMALKGRM